MLRAPPSAACLRHDGEPVPPPPLPHHNALNSPHHPSPREPPRMWPHNALTKRLGLKWPILQAPMGSASTPALAAAVANAGGLGALGMWGRSAAEAGRRLAGFRQ